MQSTTVSIAEGKKGFSRLIHDTQKNKENIIVTRRGKPVAVIVPYEEYKRTLRMYGYRKIMEVREVFSKVGVNAEDAYKESKEQLEGLR